jgi:hypothetical protein
MSTRMPRDPWLISSSDNRETEREHENEAALAEEGRFTARRSSPKRSGRRAPARTVASARRPSSAQARRPTPWVFQPREPGRRRFGAAAPTVAYPAPVELPEPAVIPAQPSDVDGDDGSAAPVVSPEGSDGVGAQAAAEPAADAPQEEPQEELLIDAREVALGSWQRVAITRYPATLPAGGGVYIVERSGRPIHVGETQSFESFWRRRFLDLYEMGWIDVGPLGAPFALSFWFAPVRPDRSAARRQVCRAIVHALFTGGSGKFLRNQEMWRASDGSSPLRIRGILPPLGGAA